MNEKANIERPGLLHQEMPSPKNCLKILTSKNYVKNYKKKKVVHTWVCSKLIVMTLKTSLK